jgi:hypothetical protein
MYISIHDRKSLMIKKTIFDEIVISITEEDLEKIKCRYLQLTKMD